MLTFIVDQLFSALHIMIEQLEEYIHVVGADHEVPLAKLCRLLFNLGLCRCRPIRLPS